MKPLTDKQREKWEKTRQLGPRRYALFYGVLLWGVPTAILWAAAMSAIQGWNRLPGLLLIALIGFPIGGIFFGKLMWKIFEGRFQATLPTRTKKKRG
jgi:hypothetical protein